MDKELKQSTGLQKVCAETAIIFQSIELLEEGVALVCGGGGGEGQGGEPLKIALWGGKGLQAFGADVEEKACTLDAMEGV